MDTLLIYEHIIRLAAFLSLYGVFSSLEVAFPRRHMLFLRTERWFTNVAMVVLDTLMLRLLIPILPLGLAAYVQSHGWGVFPFLELPYGVQIILTVFVLDCVIYWQHVFFHKIPFFWHFHKVHHTDLDFDVSTGVRFHPIEIFFSTLIKLTAVFTLGAPIVGVILFDIVLNATSLFNHSNLGIPKRIDSVLRLLVVTPDMHRVHHSIYPLETNSNFGFNFPWWDRIFKSYTPQPKLGHLKMPIGLNEYREIKDLKLWKLLVLPFK